MGFDYDGDTDTDSVVLKNITIAPEERTCLDWGVAPIPGPQLVRPEAGAACSQRLCIGIHGVRAPPSGRSKFFGSRDGVSPRPKHVRRLRGVKSKVKRILNKEHLTHNILYAVGTICQAGET
jgi:hypothetical protein